MEPKADVTRHGEKRIRQRVGINKKAVAKNADKALACGLDHNRAKGRLKHYIEWLYNKCGGTGNNIRVYNGYVYVFHDETLITILYLPNEYRRSARLRAGCRVRRS